jgi:hypothetical protein
MPLLFPFREAGGILIVTRAARDHFTDRLILIELLDGPADQLQKISATGRGQQRQSREAVLAGRNHFSSRLPRIFSVLWGGGSVNCGRQFFYLSGQDACSPGDLAKVCLSPFIGSFEGGGRKQRTYEVRKTNMLGANLFEIRPCISAAIRLGDFLAGHLKVMKLVAARCSRTIAEQIEDMPVRTALFREGSSPGRS